MPLGLSSAGVQLRTPAGSGASKRLGGLIWGYFSRIWGICSCEGGGVGAGCGQCPGLCCWGFPRPRGGFSVGFGVVFAWVSPLALPSGRAGNHGEAVYPAVETAGCGGVRRCPGGRRGREGPGDAIAFLLLLLQPGKDATLPCQHRPLGKRADVCVLSHAGVRACLPLRPEPG